MPVPPYTCESVVEPLTTPLIDCSIPFTLPRVKFDATRFVVDAMVAKNEVVVAFPKSAVVMVPDAIVVLPFAVSAPLKMLVPVKVFDEYILGMVVEASMKYVALVVDHERPTDAKYVALVVLKKSRLFFQLSALVVEKKKPLSMLERYDELSEVVAMTLPCALVERRALGVLVTAREVVVAFVKVLFPVHVLVSERRVDDAAMRDDVEKV